MRIRDFALAAGLGLLPSALFAQASIESPSPGQHVGVPLDGTPVALLYRASGNAFPPPLFAGPLALGTTYTWTRDGANPRSTSGSPWGASSPIYYYESAVTRGPHTAEMDSRTTYIIVAPFGPPTHFTIPSRDVHPYVVQHVPTAEIVNAPDSLMVFEPAWFEGSGTVDTEYSKSKTPLFTWDFGDGEVQPSASTLKFYREPGIYDATFSVGDGTFTEEVHRTVRVQAETDEAFVTDYLGYFQLGRLSDLEPAAGTTPGLFDTYSSSSYASIVPGIVATANSAGALKRPSQPLPGGGQAGFVHRGPLNRSTLEFWMKVPDPLLWPLHEAPDTQPELIAEIVRGPGWVLTLATTRAQAGGRSGELRLYAVNYARTLSYISAPVADFSVPHLVTIADGAPTLPTNILQANAAPPVYGLIVDGVSYGTLSNPAPRDPSKVNDFWPQVIGTPTGNFPANPVQAILGHYRETDIIYDEAVLYGRIVTVQEALARYRGERLPVNPREVVDTICRRLPQIDCP